MKPYSEKPGPGAAELKYGKMCKKMSCVPAFGVLCRHCHVIVAAGLLCQRCARCVLSVPV
jgi:hypothetical protein